MTIYHGRRVRLPGSGFGRPRPATEPSSGPAGRPAGLRPARSGRRLAFFVLAAGFFLTQLDTTIVNVAIPTLSRYFPGSSLASLSWTLNGYAIVFAALMIPAGRWADRIGRKKMFLGGVALFSVASLLCGLASDVPFLIAARVLQAVGAAALVPTSLGLLLALYPAERRTRAVGAWAAIGGVAPVFGTLAGGALLAADWRWIFFINLPVGLFTVIAGGRALARDVRTERGQIPDVIGALLLIASLSMATLALVEVPDWSGARVAALLVGAGVLLAVVVRRCATHPSPLLSLPLLRIPSFAMANITALLYSSGFAAMVFSYMLWCQDVLHWSALRTGVMLLPGTLLIPVAARAAAPLAARIGAVAVVAIGCAGLAAGVAWWALTVSIGSAYGAALLPGLILTCAGSALSITALIGAATGGLPAASFATGSAVVNMVRQLGMAFGVSLFIMVLGRPVTPAATQAAFRHGWVFTAALSAVAMAVSIVLGVWTRRRAAPVPGPAGRGAGR